MSENKLKLNATGHLIQPKSFHKLQSCHEKHIHISVDSQILGGVLGEAVFMARPPWPNSGLPKALAGRGLKGYNTWLPWVIL